MATDALAHIPSFPEPVPSSEVAAPESAEPVLDLPLVGHLIPHYGGEDIKKHRQPALKNVGKDVDGRNIPHVRSEEVARMVAKLVAFGHDENEICVLLNLRRGQLRHYYPNELMHGAALANASVAETALAMATSGASESMTKFWLEKRSKTFKVDKGQGTGEMLDIHIHLP